MLKDISLQAFTVSLAGAGNAGTATNVLGFSGNGQDFFIAKFCLFLSFFNLKKKTTKKQEFPCRVEILHLNFVLHVGHGDCVA